MLKTTDLVSDPFYEQNDFFDILELYHKLQS